MTDIEKLIEDLRGLLKQYGEKIPYGELVGAPWPYSRAGDLVWQDPEPYFIEQAATAISTLQAENEKLRAELERVKRECDEAVKAIERVRSCKDCGHYTGEWTPPCKECQDSEEHHPYFKWRGQKKED